MSLVLFSKTECYVTGSVVLWEFCGWFELSSLAWCPCVTDRFGLCFPTLTTFPSYSVWEMWELELWDPVNAWQCSNWILFSISVFIPLWHCPGSLPTSQLAANSIGVLLKYFNCTCVNKLNQWKCPRSAKTAHLALTGRLNQTLNQFKIIILFKLRSDQHRPAISTTLCRYR